MVYVKSPNNVISNFVNNVQGDFDIPAWKEPYPKDNKSIKIIHRK